MKDRTLMFALAGTLVALSGCSGSSTSTSDSGGVAGLLQSKDESAFPDAKTFAHRYNALANDDYKISEVQEVRFRGNHYFSMPLAFDRWETFSYGDYDAQVVSYGPTKGRAMGVAFLTQICSQLVRAAVPTVSKLDADAMASAAVVRGDSMTVGTVIISPFPAAMMVGHGCKIRLSGL
ncbi:hypothetical protein [Dyella kyungheensis]|uniref:Lipoprotein n=1 Tax=Dyella kyungheensis TaxID=1242174 RepID=A0ABS2JNR1_9GAMM|nr:hypothetical protein [Dyella kyungheensis]MBM7120214.1 hypothetical protein [Dyella kyungheensis]